MEASHIILMAMSSGSELKAVARKLHLQFAHPTSERLIKLLKDGGYKDKDLMKEVKYATDKCDICIRRQKPPLRPVVCMPMAKNFNEVVAIDLKVWGNKYFLVAVDLATRFCQATVISNKEASTIIKGLFKCWITLFGAPKKFLSDNGCEFNNGEFRTLGEKFNVKILATAAESPWSNGVCERLNAVIGENVSRILDDTQCDLELALAWAISARNALSNKSGFSPNQLVFSFNPAIPDIFHSEPPALEPVSSSETVRQNLGALHLARREFIRSESDEKIKRALRHKVRPTRVENLVNGDNVYYKRNDSAEWHGPGVVIGIDNKQVLVRHGGTVVRVHTARLVGAPSEDRLVETQGTQRDAPEKNGDVRIETRCHLEDITEEQRPDTPVDTPVEPVNSECDTGPSEEVPRESTVEVNTEAGEEVETENSVSSQVQEEASLSKSVTKGGNFWKPGSRFSGVDENTGECVAGKIIGRAGKARGRNRNCYNIQRDNGWRGWYNFRSLKDLSVMPESCEVAVFFNSDAVDKAKGVEYESWVENKVFIEVDDQGQKVITVRWVVSEKEKDGKIITKARLCARGFEENTECLRKDSPTSSKETVRILLSLAALNSWDCHTLDVKAAYLQGNEIEREVYLKPPPEFYNGKLWKLKKTVYGLCDAARAWYTRVRDELISLSAERCSLDSSLFMWYNEGKLEGLVSIYVDDFIWAGTADFESGVIEKIRDKFLIGSSASRAFCYVGLNMVSTNEGVTVDQFQYASSLEPICISRGRSTNKHSELSESEKTDYRGLLGQLNWLATNTRPDIAFDICDLSVSIKKATIADLLRLNKVVDRVVKDSVKLLFPRIQSLESCSIECYTDAAFANLSTGGSQGGLIIFLKDSTGLRCPIFWQSRKLKRVVKSTLAAETLALVEGAEVSYYIASIIKEVTKIKDVPINCFVDNKSLVDALSSSNQVEDRRLRIDIAVLDDMIEKKEINHVAWVDTCNQLADCLTKRGASTEKLRLAVYK